MRGTYNLCNLCGKNSLRSIGTSHRCTTIRPSGKAIRKEADARRKLWRDAKKAADLHNKFRTQTVVVRAEAVHGFVRKRRNHRPLTVEIPK